MTKEQQYTVPMPKGGEIVLHRLLPAGGNAVGLPVVVAHGTLSNAGAVRDLAVHLLSFGFDCWLLEWGGHGQSTPYSKWQNFEYPAFNDVPVCIETVLAESGHKALYWVSHSGGGHLPLMHLVQNPQEHHKVAGIATIGSQSTKAALSIQHKLRAYVLRIVSNLFGGIPQRLIPMGTVEGEPTRLLDQWAKWNLQQKWVGDDGTDYLASLVNLTMPFFMIAGGNDDIAPAAGCFDVFQQFGGDDKTWLECSREAGFSKDYNHGQLVRGGAAKQEIFPKISDWLLVRNT